MKVALIGTALVGLGVTCQRIDEPAARVLEPVVQAPSEPVARRPAAAPTTIEGKPATMESHTCVVPRADPPPEPPYLAGACPAPKDVAAPLDESRIVFVDVPGTLSIVAEVAATQEQKTRGLMYRRTLARDRGMLFPYENEDTHSFWMRNTCIPLDMLFIGADGTIVGILEQVPTLNEAPRSVPCPSQYVLEVNAGWTRANSVLPGQKNRIERTSKP